MFPLLLVFAAILSTVLAFGQSDHADTAPPPIGPHKDASGFRDAVTQLVRRMDAGQTRLGFDAERGLLPAVLRELRVGASSQVLVFSKTSLQHQYITPQTPRALYFNDDVYVGFVPDGSVIELSAVDPERGAIFYTLGQSAGSRPRLVTNEDCLQCHAAAATQGVPGYLVRSVFTRPDGQVAPRTKTFLTDDRSPLEDRWGGWYVTGALGGNMHMGNAVLRQSDDAASFDRAPGSSIRSLTGRFRDDRYLTAESDVVALMVLAHQTRMHNLLARLHHDATEQLPLAADMDELLKYMLFADEAALHGPVAGTTRFADEFEKLGPKDARGRSLRQFDLRTRLFRYPCSFMVYSDAFMALPQPVRQQLYGRLAQILSGGDTSAAFAGLQPADRQAISEILTATHGEFAAFRAADRRVSQSRRAPRVDGLE